MVKRQVDEGLVLYTQNNYEDAIKKWKTALHKMKDNRLRFTTLGYIASACRDRGRNRDYLVYSVQQIDIAHELDDNVFRSQAYLNLARANEILADYFKAVSYSRSSLQHACSNDRIQGYAYLTMADAYIGICNFSKTLECLDKTLSIAREHDDYVMEIQLLNTMGKVFLALKDFPKGLKYQEKALQLAISNAKFSNEETSNTATKFVRLTKLKLATPYRLLGDYDSATKCVEEAMSSASAVGDRPVQAKCLVVLGDIQRSKDNAESTSHSEYVYYTMLFSSFVHSKTACKKYQAALPMLQDMGDRYGYTLSMLCLAKALIKLEGQKHTAVEVLSTALSTAQAIGNKLLQARCYLLNEIGYLSENRSDDAKIASETAYRLFKEMDLYCICDQPIGFHREALQILPCTHIFHERCIIPLLQKWTVETQNCPRCKKGLIYNRSYVAFCCD
ncbi:unnamed protein product [Didymodactylos carnosus]|uniref:RING-type domain-containing protein n=1 Tax=Didymodactylos carnosus TaxID=1234261 RepID=A0A814Y0M6_9BILA|nr:unnamed protein product [Didymodactylos carnosus]CAF1401655.1 unnamed protein product [Didymodactylos carnosus]CAF3986220.1 unnamed protein product [Didymodactylos carnosus]CAF4208740.1 unnamed protein product [Didymodactylos carnosus]